MTRVALVSPYALSAYGGVQEQVLAMSRELSSRGAEVVVVAPDASDRARYETPATVVRLGRLTSVPANGSRAPITLSPRASREALHAITDFKPDVVHLHEPFAPLLGWRTLRAHGFAAVGTFHRNGGGPALATTGPLLRMLAKGLDASAAVSESAATTARRACGLEPVVLFNGFETARFVEFGREHGAEPLLITLGRLEARKGVDVAIEAVRRQNERGLERWRLVVVGDGPDRQRLEALAAPDDRISFVGAVDDESKRRWLRRADVLLAPSLRGESFGLVLLEAMASETPVVASDIDGYRQAAGGHAALSRPGDAASLVEAVNVALASTPDSLAGARAHAQRWSMSSLVDAYEDLYERARHRFAHAH